MILDKVLSRFGYSRNGTASARKANGDYVPVPVINDGAGNRPEIRVRYLSGGPTSYGGGWGGWGPHDYAARVQAGYQRNSDVYACVSLIATAAKQVKWASEDKMIEQDGLRGKPAASLRRFKQAGGPAFIEAWISYLLLSGNAYVEITRNDAGTPGTLYLLQPDQVTPRTNKENRPDGKQLTAESENHLRVERWFVRNIHGMPYPVEPEDMMHSKLFNPLSSILGMAPLEAAMLRVGLQNQSAQYGKLAFERGFVPGWIEARPDSTWSDTQVAQLQERIALSKAAGRELFLENALYHDTGLKPSESSMTDISLLSKRDIASVFHIDPGLIGDVTGRTYATHRESQRALYTSTVIPLLTQFREDWNRTIGAELASPLAWDKDSFDAIAALREETADRVQKLWTSGLITQDEARADLEYDPPKPGDVFYGPANLVPLGMDVEPPAKE
jgi:HK97 family phage portal protein